MLRPVYGIRSKRGYFSQSQQWYICFNQRGCLISVVRNHFKKKLKIKSYVKYT
jgi:hypothetical protein